MNAEAHWQKIYATKAADRVSWYRQHLETSLALIGRAIGGGPASVIDVGGGESTLVDDLLARSNVSVTVLDISQIAIDVTKQRLGAAAERVNWITGDVTQIQLEERAYDVWHDRAVFHFLMTAEQRAAYVRNTARAVNRGGHVIVSTFGLAGPRQCSGLEVVRYDAEALHDEFGAQFRLVESTKEIHRTPFGTTQQFVYCYCRID